MSSVITIREDSNGRLDQVKIQQKGKLALKAYYAYVNNGLSIHMEGRKQEMPTTAELLAMIDAKYNNVQSNWNFHTIALANGKVTLWTPNAGRSFHLIGGLLSIGAGTVTSALETRLYLRDSQDAAATQSSQMFVFELNATAAAYTFTDPLIVPLLITAPGYFSIKPDNLLVMELGQPFTAGALIMTVWGTEE